MHSLSAVADNEILQSVAGSLATRAATAVGSRIFCTARSLRKRDAAADIQVARVLSSYEVIESLSPKASDLFMTKPEPQRQAIVEFLNSIEAQSIAHEMLTSSLVGAGPDNSVELARLFNRRLHAKFQTSLDDPSLSAWLDEIAEVLFDFLWERCAEITEAVEQAQPETAARIRSGAAYSLIADTLSAIERHISSFCGNQADPDAEDDSFRVLYLRQMRKLHGSIIPPDFDRKRDVPLEELYVSPEIRKQFAGVGLEQEAIDLGTLWNRTDRTVLLGEPGGGKSTATGALLFRLSASETGITPYLVTLRDYAQTRNELSIVEYVERRLRTHYQTEAPEGFVERSLLAGTAAVFFDGLDELLETAARREVTEVVEAFSSRFPMARILVTSRKVGYTQAPMNSLVFDDYVLSNFSDEHVGEYVKKWFTLNAETDDDAAELTGSFLRESTTVADLRRNPLMLALMCIIYRGQHFIPRNRPAVYERCATLLFETWDSSRQIKADLTAEEYLDDALKHLALWMLKSDSTAEGVTREQLISETTRYFHGRAFEDLSRAKRAASQFVDFCKGRAWVFSDAGTTADGSELFKFTHRTFMEYFAAFELTRLTESPEKLAKELLPKVARQEWDMVGQLAVQIANKQAKDGSQRVLDALLSDKRRRTDEHRANILVFVSTCLSFANVNPMLLRKVAQFATNGFLESGTAYLGAFRALVREPTDDAAEYIADEWRIIVSKALSSPSVEVIRKGYEIVLILNVFNLVRADGKSEGTARRWQVVQLRILREFSEGLLENARQFESVRQSAFRYGHMDINQFLSMASDTGRALDFLFANARFALLNFSDISLAGWLCEALGNHRSGRIDGVSDVVSALANEVSARMTRQNLPWVGKVRTLGFTYSLGFHFLFSPPATSLSPFNLDFRVGVFLECCAYEELSAAGQGISNVQGDTTSQFFLIAAREDLGDFRERVTTSGDKSDIEPLLVDWCLGRVDFTSVRPRNGRR